MCYIIQEANYLCNFFFITLGIFRRRRRTRNKRRAWTKGKVIAPFCSFRFVSLSVLLGKRRKTRLRRGSPLKDIFPSKLGGCVLKYVLWPTNFKSLTRIWIVPNVLIKLTDGKRPEHVLVSFVDRNPKNKSIVCLLPISFNSPLVEIVYFYSYYCISTPLLY